MGWNHQLLVEKITDRKVYSPIGQPEVPILCTILFHLSTRSGLRHQL